MCKVHKLSTMRTAAGVAPYVSPVFKLRCLCATSSEQVRDTVVAEMEMDSLFMCFVNLKSK